MKVTTAKIPFNYPVLSYRVIDGDSVEVVIDRGWNDSSKKSCRIFGVDAPERHTDAGKAVKRAVSAFLDVGSEIGEGALTVVSFHPGKYANRFVGDISSPSNGGLAKFLFDKGLVRRYEGGKRAPWGKAELFQIECAANVATEELQESFMKSSV